MGLKENNEITVKIECNLDELYNILEKKDFKIVDKFSMDDAYFVPNEIDLDKTNSREILMQAVLAVSYTHLTLPTT